MPHSIDFDTFKTIKPGDVVTFWWNAGETKRGVVLRRLNSGTVHGVRLRVERVDRKGQPTGEWGKTPRTVHAHEIHEVETTTDYLRWVVTCEACEERWCTLHEKHWADCECPGPEQWDWLPGEPFQGGDS